MILSKFLSLNKRDYIKGLIVAIMSSVSAFIATSIGAGGIEVNLKVIGWCALSSALGYIGKNLMTNSKGEMFKSES